MNWRDWIAARLAERSTWLGVIAIVGAAGYAIRPDLAEAIITLGTGLAGTLLAVGKD